MYYIRLELPGALIRSNRGGVRDEQGKMPRSRVKTIISYAATVYLIDLANVGSAGT